MSRKLYLVVSGTIFCLVASLHLLRLIFDWQAQVGTWIIPFWLSWGGLIGASILSAWGFSKPGEIKPDPAQLADVVISDSHDCGSEWGFQTLSLF